MECRFGSGESGHIDCPDPSHGTPCCYTCCDVCRDECIDPEVFGICDECNKPYNLASHLDHNPETGLHYECETGWFRFDMTGAMKDELEQVLLDMLYSDPYDKTYNYVVLQDALTVIEEAERRVLDRF